jgi:CDP-diacylglycerol--glycerol-3-phosphate 3-phosphatidyltransferase
VSVSDHVRERARAGGEPIALFFGRLGFSPDGLTLLGFAITSLGAVLLAMQQWAVGGLVVLAGGAFDMLDGLLARATGRVSALGAFMDSVFDRWGEALVYVGLVAGLSAAAWEHGPLVASLAMASAFLVSYARARSEGLGLAAGQGGAAVGLMPREVRLLVLCGGLIAGGLLGTDVAGAAEGAVGAGPGRVVILATLGIIAVGATITLIQRILHARGRAGPPAGPDPAAHDSNAEPKPGAG